MAYTHLMDLPVAELASDAHRAELEALRAQVTAQSQGNKQILQAGWMLKRKEKGRGKVSGWKKRFVVLDVDTLSYFKAPGEDRLGAFELLLTEAKAPNEEVKTGAKHYGLACVEDAASIGDWLMAIVEQRRVLFQGKDAAAMANKALAKMGGKGGKGSKVAPRTTTLGADYMKASQDALPADDLMASALGGAAVSAEDPKRQAAVMELISTEEVYVNNLGVIIRQWRDGLAQIPGVDAQTLQAVFSNVALLEPVNAQLLARLRRPESRQAIGVQFLEMMPFFKMYKDYCGNQSAAMDALEALKKNKKAVREFLDKQRDHPACNSMNIESFLIMPMQRICRYPLILGEIIKWTPEEWDDHAQLRAALDAVAAVGKEVNDQKKTSEQQALLLEIQATLRRDNKDTLGGDLLTPSRRLIGQRTLVRADVFGAEVDAPHVYLFNDLLLVCRVDAKKKKTLLLNRIELDAAYEVADLPWGFSEPSGFVLVHDERGRVELLFEEEEIGEARAWQAALRDALSLLREAAARRGDDDGGAAAGEPDNDDDDAEGPSAKHGLLDRLRAGTGSGRRPSLGASADNISPISGSKRGSRLNALSPHEGSSPPARGKPSRASVGIEVADGAARPMKRSQSHATFTGRAGNRATSGGWRRGETAAPHAESPPDGRIKSPRAMSLLFKSGRKTSAPSGLALSSSAPSSGGGVVEPKSAEELLAIARREAVRTGASSAPTGSRAAMGSAPAGAAGDESEDEPEESSDEVVVHDESTVVTAAPEARPAKPLPVAPQSDSDGEGA